MPETWAGITFDENGVCNVCRNYEQKKFIDWEGRQEALELILEEYKARAKKEGNKYEAIVGFSGGKDSSFTLYYAVKELKLKILVVTFDHGFHLTPEGEWNLSQIPKILDCDHIRFAIGNGLRNSLCKIGTKLIGDFCIACHLGVGVTAARISKAWNIPLQIWGESNVYGGISDAFDTGILEEQNEDHFKKMFQGGMTPEIIKPDGYELRDLQPLMWPSGEFSLKAIYLGDYLGEWEQEEHARIIKQELGWKDYPKQETWQSWDKNDCPLELVREAQKKLRRGFGKASFAASKEIRDGKISREQGMKLVEEYENKELVGLDKLCQEMGFNSFDELKSITNLKI
jgi:N-acetyl sugar amidotransferase